MNVAWGRPPARDSRLFELQEIPIHKAKQTPRIHNLSTPSEYSSCDGSHLFGLSVTGLYRELFGPEQF